MRGGRGTAAAPRAGGDRRDRRRRGDPQKHHRQGNRNVHPRVGEAGPAPAEAPDQPGRERPGNRAREATPERQRGDGAPRLQAVEPPECGEGGVVEPRPHARADHHPGGEVQGIARRRRQTREPRREQERRRRERRPTPVRVDRPPHPDRDRARRQQPHRNPADHPDKGPARVPRNRRGQHSQEVVGRSPDQDLHDPERRDDPRPLPAVRHPRTHRGLTPTAAPRRKAPWAGAARSRPSSRPRRCWRRPSRCWCRNRRPPARPGPSPSPAAAR